MRNFGKKIFLSCQMVNSMKNQARSSSSVGVKPLTTLTDDELVMKQTGESSNTFT